MLIKKNKLSASKLHEFTYKARATEYEYKLKKTKCIYVKCVYLRITVPINDFLGFCEWASVSINTQKIILKKVTLKKVLS